MLTVRYEWWIARIRNDGEFHLPLGELPVPLTEFRRELRRAAKAAGLSLRTSAQYDMFLAWDPEYDDAQQGGDPSDADPPGAAAQHPESPQ